MQATKREKNLIIVVCLAAALLATHQLFVKPLQARRHTLQRVIPQKQKTLAQLKQKAADYRQLQEKIQRLRSEKLVEQNGFSLLSFLERSAADNQIAITSVKPSMIDRGDVCRELQVAVKLQDTSLDKIVKLLAAVDSAESPIAVRSLDIRHSQASPGKLAASLTLTAAVATEKS